MVRYGKIDFLFILFLNPTSLQKTSLYYHQSTGWLQYNVLKGEYESCEPKSKYKEKWKTKKLRLSAIRRFGNEYVKSMDQEAIDVCTLLFDLINRVVFLSGDESQSRKFAELGQFDEELQVSFWTRVY